MTDFPLVRLSEIPPECPGSVSGHWVDNKAGTCEWCGLKVLPSLAEEEAAAERYRVRQLAKEADGD